MICKLTTLVLVASALLPAQTVETIGGMNSSPTGSNRAKANLFAVDTSVIMIDFEMYLDVPGPETLTFFAYRHHSRSGTAPLEWTIPVTVTGGTGPQWVSTGPIAIPLIAGNHYAIGCSWTGGVTYYYSTNGAAMSFGTWQRAHTLTNPVPATLNIPASVDAARYYQRFTTVPTNSVVNVGTGCSANPAPPRLVAAGDFPINATQTVDLVDASPSSLGVFAMAIGPTLPVPLPVFGCDIWLDINAMATLATTTDAAGYSNFALSVPNNPALSGSQYSLQALVLGTTVELTNAIDFSIN